MGMSRRPVSGAIIPVERIHGSIHVIRGSKVMLDRDLAELYRVETRALKQAVRRNKKRFPPDFIFILNEKEIQEVVSQTVIPSKSIFGGAAPYAFTEHGVAMLSSVLKSGRAIEVNIQIMRAFTELRQMAFSYAALAQKITAMERKYDANFRDVFDAIKRLVSPPERSGRKIGFK
jgi:hypothetical protein